MSKIKDWLPAAIEERTIIPEQVANILERRSKSAKEFRELMQIYEAPQIPSLISKLDLLHLPNTINDPKI